MWNIYIYMNIWRLNGEYVFIYIYILYYIIYIYVEHIWNSTENIWNTFGTYFFMKMS